MKQEEIKNYIENQIAYHCDEFGLTREEATEVVLLNCVEFFYNDQLSKEDLLQCARYLEYEIGIDAIEKEKAVRQKRKEKAREFKEKQGL